LDPIVAVTHADPYPYYAELVARRPLHRHDALGVWIAASADAVSAVLTSAHCRVRPAAEPVPSAIVGSPAGAIFGRLVRMNDGARQAALKSHVSRVLDALVPPRIAALSQAWARKLAGDLHPASGGRALDAFTWQLAPSVVARLLGAPDDRVPDVVRATDDFVRGIAPGASADAVTRGADAARNLMELGRSLAKADGLAAALAHDASGEDLEAAIANALGFLSQSYEATAGLIGNTLVTLARHPELRAAPALAVVTEVARYDAPVQNTRRFVATDAVVSGQAMQAGDVILVVLAAANRDPAVNDDPARCDVMRAAPRVFTFGLGAHACPGAMLATTIAAAGVTTLIEGGFGVEGLGERVRYRPSVNTRVPLVGAG
jgi:cytochrome P450